MKALMPPDFELTDDEIEFLSDGRRCETCGHLWVLHNGHCCAFCMVGDCECREYDFVS